MKRIALFFLIACLCCSFVACDMGNGLIAELFGNSVSDGVIDYGDYDYPPMPGTSTDLPMIEETWIEVDYAIPALAEMEYLTAYVMYANGSVRELMSYEDLREWNGTLSVSYAPGAVLLIKAYAAYFYSDVVRYSCSAPDSACGIYDFSWSYLPEDHDPIQGDGVHSFYIEIPLDSLSVGHNQCDLYTYAADVMIDGWVMMQTYDILLEAYEGDMTEDGYLETDYPVPPETMPTEDTTEVPDIEETTEDVTYG